MLLDVLNLHKVNLWLLTLALKKECQPAGDSSYHAEKDRRRNCDTLTCFIHLLVIVIQVCGSQCDQMAVFNTMAWIATWETICVFAEVCMPGNLVKFLKEGGKGRTVKEFGMHYIIKKTSTTKSSDPKSLLVFYAWQCQLFIWVTGLCSTFCTRYHWTSTHEDVCPKHPKKLYTSSFSRKKRKKPTPSISIIDIVESLLQDRRL